ncbi:hypothetical protein [Pseudomonas gozinkensis]|uniref:hypothetical protein n=1 Tax=Pseudomonas gozinkensis TaxID=2774461 RepID=UPI00178808AE|nr:hypothetical protein [Pseudomonas gozinkensis]
MKKNSVLIAGAAGDLDPSFVAPALQFPGAQKTVGHGVGIIPTGKIMVSATVTTMSGETCYGLARLHADGPIDSTFGRGGYVVEQYKSGLSSQGGPLLIDEAGRIYVCGLIPGLSTPFQQVIARFLPDGSLDADFGSSRSGYVVVPMRTPTLAGAFAGSLILARSDPEQAVPDRLLFTTSKGGSGLLTRLFLDGTEDTAFASKGWLVITLAGLGITLIGITQLPNGGILVYGGTSGVSQGLVMAFDSNGQVDPAFGVGGMLLLDVREGSDVLENSITDLVIQPPQRLLLMGDASRHSGGERHQYAFVAAIDLQGNNDRSFNNGDTVLIPPVDSKDLKRFSKGFALDDRHGQRIVAVGQMSGATGHLLARGFTRDGMVDPQFNERGTHGIGWAPDDACLQGSSVLMGGTDDGNVYLTRMLTASGI